MIREGEQPVNTFNEVWNKLKRSKKYRESFVFSLFKRTVPFQIRSLRKQRGWSQEELAMKSAITQGVVSRAEDDDYGNLTINTICRIAAGFDVAFMGKFVPFTELDRWFITLSEKSAQVPSFDVENAALEAAEAQQQVKAAFQSMVGELGSLMLVMSPSQPQANVQAIVGKVDAEAMITTNQESNASDYDNVISINRALKPKGQKLSSPPQGAERKGAPAYAAIGGSPS
jgi:transcriptional regulator with XRE-family HTH domain